MSDLLRKIQWPSPLSQNCHIAYLAGFSSNYLSTDFFVFSKNQVFVRGIPSDGMMAGFIKPSSSATPSGVCHKNVTKNLLKKISR
jgi:hypothetical protein